MTALNALPAIRVLQVRQDLLARTVTLVQLALQVVTDHQDLQVMMERMAIRVLPAILVMLALLVKMVLRAHQVLLVLLVLLAMALLVQLVMLGFPESKGILALLVLPALLVPLVLPDLGVSSNQAVIKLP
jgi:hypothetical protein